MAGKDKQGREKGKKPVLTQKEKRQQKRAKKEERKQTVGEQVKDQLHHK